MGITNIKIVGGENMKEKKQIKSCKYCKDYFDKGKYCYAFQIDVSSTRNAKNCTGYKEVSNEKKQRIRNASKHRII